MDARAQLKNALTIIFRDMNEGAEERDEHDFVFHLLECAEELGKFADICRNPNSYNAEDTKKIVAAVLYHASGHLAQAARLYDYFPDPFQEKQQPEDPVRG